MLGHVTSSANVQLYTIQIIKTKNLMRLSKRGVLIHQVHPKVEVVKVLHLPQLIGDILTIFNQVYI